MELPGTLNEAVTQLKRLPGIGERSAIRLALSILSWDKENIKNLSSSLNGLLEIKNCTSCNALCDREICSLCQDPNRIDKPIMCVVESMSDLLAIENSGEFSGSYFVLTGVLNPLKGIGPDEIGVPNLCKAAINRKISNIVLAVNPSIEGDATCSYLNEVLPDGIIVDRIGFGVPMGGSLEYLDSMTISQALKNRKTL
ncbi:MAG: recombination protein RecR [Bacteriovoracaceae bacterium]|jgi:recombination protein RecR